MENPNVQHSKLAELNRDFAGGNFWGRDPGPLPPPSRPSKPDAQRQPLFDQFTGERLQPGQQGAPGHSGMPNQQWGNMAGMPMGGMGMHPAWFMHPGFSMAPGHGGGAMGAGASEAPEGKRSGNAELAAAMTPDAIKKLIEEVLKSKEGAKAGEAQDHRGAAAAFGAKTKEIAAKIEAEKSGGNPEKVRRWMNPVRRWLTAFGLGLPGGAVAALTAKAGVAGISSFAAVKGMAGFTIGALTLPAWPIIAAGLGAGLAGGIIWHKLSRKIKPFKGWEEGMEQGWRARKLYKRMEADDSMAAIERKYDKIRRRPSFFRMQAIPRIMGGILGGATAVDAANMYFRGEAAPFMGGTRTGQLQNLAQAGWNGASEIARDPVVFWESIRTKLVDMLGGASPDAAPIEELRSLLEQARWSSVLEQTTSLGNLLDSWNVSEQSAFLNAPGNVMLHNEFVALHDEIARLENAGLTLEQYQEELRKLQERVQEWIQGANEDFRNAVAESTAGTVIAENAYAQLERLELRVENWITRNGAFFDSRLGGVFRDEFITLQADLDALDPRAEDYAEQVDELQRQADSLIERAEEEKVKFLAEARHFDRISGLRDEYVRGTRAVLDRFAGFLAEHPDWRGEIETMRTELEELDPRDFDRPGDYETEFRRRQRLLSLEVNELTRQALAAEGIPPASESAFSRWPGLRALTADSLAFDITNAGGESPTIDQGLRRMFERLGFTGNAAERIISGISMSTYNGVPGVLDGPGIMRLLTEGEALNPRAIGDGVEVSIAKYLQRPGVGAYLSSFIQNSNLSPAERGAAQMFLEGLWRVAGR